VTQSVATVGIVGLGLIGGSLALALREAGFAGTFIGWDRDEAVARRGEDFGVIDEAAASLEDLATRADLVIIATPTRAAEAILRELLTLTGAMASPPWLTDVASVKGPLCEIAAAAGDAARRYVPGHPIAGSERSGVGAADAALFREHRVILTPIVGTDAEAVAVVTAMWEAAGASVVQLPVAEHDAVLAATSHLPHALAYALVHTLARSERSSDIFRFAAGGFRDFTRIASSDPVMWRDIALANAPALLAAIDEFAAELAALREAVARGDGDALEDTFRAANAARDEFAQDLRARQRRRPAERS
jgi:3-phosphoshikimate 1-carboxyvinyltransferase